MIVATLAGAWQVFFYFAVRTIALSRLKPGAGFYRQTSQTGGLSKRWIMNKKHIVTLTDQRSALGIGENSLPYNGPILNRDVLVSDPPGSNPELLRYQLPTEPSNWVATFESLRFSNDWTCWYATVNQ